MPTYSSRCPRCGTEQDYIARIIDRDKTPTCCDVQSERFIVPPMITALGISDSFSIDSPIDGKPVYGRSDYLGLLKKHNIQPMTEIKGEAEHRQQALKEETASQRRETIAKVVHTTGG